MYKHVLIATDGSDLAGKALTQGLALAKALSARVTIVTVVEPWPAMTIGEAAIAFPYEEYEQAAMANAEDILSKAGEVAGKSGVSCETVPVKGSYPAEGILETAKSRDCDLIVMASHGRRGLTRLVLGSQANDVVTHSTLPVLICR